MPPRKRGVVTANSSELNLIKLKVPYYEKSPRRRGFGTANTAIKYILYFIATVFLLLVVAWVLNKMARATDLFEAYSDWTLFILYPPQIIMYGQADMCAKICIESPWCKAFAVDRFMPLAVCRAFTHTPFYYNVRPISIALSTIYIKGDAVAPGQRRSDGFLYYLSEAPLAAATATRYCEEGSEFYFLATETEKSSALKWAKEEYLELLHKDGGHGYGIFILQHRPAKVRVGKNMLAKNMLGKKMLGKKMLGKNMVGKKDLVMVTDTITRDVPESTLGYALCQGDPINLLGSATNYRNVLYPNNTEKYFTQRIRKSKLSRPMIAMSFEPV